MLYFKIMMKIVICVSLLIVLSGTSSFADIFKHVDKDGVAHFTNIPGDGDYTLIMSEPVTARTNNYDHIIRKKSGKYNVEPAIIKAVITAESNWDPSALSKKGAIGLMQLMPATAKDMKITDPYDPEENIEAGTRYLRYLLDRFDGDLDLALAGYNAGPSRVEKAGGIPSILETKMYIKSVKSFYENLSKNTLKPIYKVTFSDDTIMYTNTPSPYKQHELSKF